MPSTPIEIAQIEIQQALHPLRPELVDARLQLDATRPVDEVKERHLALTAARRQPSRDAVGDVGLLPRRQLCVCRAHSRDRLDALELVRERVNARSAQLVELAPAGRKDVCGFFAQGEGPATWRRRSW